jgi:cytochrome P450
MQQLKQKPRTSTSTSSIPSIFDLILTPDPKKDRPVPSDDTLTAEAVLMLAAGMDTTANALRIGTWHVLSDPRVYRKLKEELRGAMPHRDEIVDSAILEDLPYLVRPNPTPGPQTGGSLG